jgi:predicted nucleic acid-binding protein
VRAVVLDSSCVIAWLVMDETVSRQATGLRADFETGRLGAFTAAPFDFEIRSGLVRAARRQRIAWGRIADELAATTRIRFGVVEPPLEERLIEICREFGLGWADAHWAELAIRLQLPLITADQRLVRALADAPIWAEWLGDRPTK